MDSYLASTAVANPHVTLRYRDPDGNWTDLASAPPRRSPPSPARCKPHPYGVELGMFLRMLQTTSEHKKVGSFLQGEFSRVSRKAASGDLRPHGDVNMTTWLSRVHGKEAPTTCTPRCPRSS